MVLDKTKATDSKVFAVIPARYGSTRFEGKMLAPILGKSLIQRTYENTLRSSSLQGVFVATDDKRIYDHIQEFGGQVFMTSSACATGTDRVAELIEKEKIEADVVVNIQGDEPSLDPTVIDTLVERLLSDESAVMTTAVTPIRDRHSLLDPSVVKCLFDIQGRALYFSRGVVPFLHKGKHPGVYHRHLGVYCFRRAFLHTYAALSPTPYQQMEDLEQLKILEHGYPIHVSVVEDEGIGVDTPEDLKKLEEVLCRENTSLSQEVSSPL